MLIQLLIHVALAIPATPSVAPAIVDAAVKEAAVVWAPYGVAVDAAGPCDEPDGGRAVLTVEFVDTPRSAATGAWRGPLGAIAFDAGGTPMPLITVLLSNLQHFVNGALVMGSREWQWPRTLRVEIIGRVLGRVLAHEIGHYVLRSRQHTDGGLMRSLHFANDLVAPSRRGFTLTSIEAARVEERSLK